MAAPPLPMETVILLDVKAKLATITKANGYNFNVGAQGVVEYEVDVGATRQDTISVVRRTTADYYDRRFGAVEYEQVLQIGFVHEYRGEAPQQRGNLFISDIRRALPLSNQITVAKISGGTAVLYYHLRRVGSAVNITDPVPGRIHGQVDYTLSYETSAEDDRRAL